VLELHVQLFIAELQLLTLTSELSTVTPEYVLQAPHN
jgi:hypothetical protein